MRLFVVADDATTLEYNLRFLLSSLRLSAIWAYTVFSGFKRCLEPLFAPLAFPQI